MDGDDADLGVAKNCQDAKRCDGSRCQDGERPLVAQQW